MKNVGLVAACTAFVLAAPASAGPFLDWSKPATAHSGDVIRAQAGAGVRMYALLPLYLVASKDTPRLHRCTLRDGHAATCPTTSLGPPQGGRYHHVATLNVRHANRVQVSFRLPRLAPGRYVYVLYCGPCWRGPRGSLIPFSYPGAPALTIVRQRDFVLHPGETRRFMAVHRRDTVSCGGLHLTVQSTPSYAHIDGLDRKRLIYRYAYARGLLLSFSAPQQHLVIATCRRR
jgi:hypothetical protein